MAANKKNNEMKKYTKTLFMCTGENLKTKEKTFKEQQKLQTVAHFPSQVEKWNASAKEQAHANQGSNLVYLWVPSVEEKSETKTETKSEK